MNERAKGETQEYSDKSSQHDALIFDLDGTLWDCTAATTRAANQTYQKFGIDNVISLELIRSITGKPADECDEIILENTPRELQSELKDTLNQEELTEVKAHAVHALYPNVREGLLKLKDHYNLCLVSNCGVEYLELFLEGSGVGDLFVDSECYGNTLKPKAENIKSLVARQGYPRPCYIGDTAGDQQAAAEAGLPFYYVSWGFGKPAGAPRSFDTFSSLTTYFLSLK